MACSICDNFVVGSRLCLVAHVFVISFLISENPNRNQLSILKKVCKSFSPSGPFVDGD